MILDPESEAELERMKRDRKARAERAGDKATGSERRTNSPRSKALALTFFNECVTPRRKNWLIKNVIATGESSSWFGPPGGLKSALLTDIAVHRAAGKDWRGYRAKQACGVVYFALERADLVKRRLAAYAARDGLKGLPIAVAGNIINLIDTTCVDIIVATIREAEDNFGCSVGLIIIDTVSKGIAAGDRDEDKARDQNIVAANLKRIHEQCTLHIATIGHSGKDESRGERGSNARLADVDMQVQITGDDIKTASTIKANDQPAGILTAFKSECVELGQDEDGDTMVTHIVADELFTGEQRQPQKQTRLSAKYELAKRYLIE